MEAVLPEGNGLVPFIVNHDLTEPKADKPKKPKLVRDSFTIPKAEYKVIEDTKVRAATLGRPVKKSEILRAGLKANAGLGDAAFIAALGAGRRQLS